MATFNNKSFDGFSLHSISTCIKIIWPTSYCLVSAWQDVAVKRFSPLFAVYFYISCVQSSFLVFDLHIAHNRPRDRVSIISRTYGRYHLIDWMQIKNFIAQMFRPWPRVNIVCGATQQSLYSLSCLLAHFLRTFREVAVAPTAVQ